MFAKLWQAKAAGVIEHLRSKAFYKSQLEGVAWSLDVGIADSTAGLTAQPNAKLQLNVANSQMQNAAALTFQRLCCCCTRYQSSRAAPAGSTCLDAACFDHLRRLLYVVKIHGLDA